MSILILAIIIIFSSFLAKLSPITGTCVWLILLSILTIGVYGTFIKKAGRGKPGGTVIHYVVCVSILSVIWFVNDIVTTIVIAFLGEQIILADEANQAIHASQSFSGYSDTGIPSNNNGTSSGVHDLVVGIQVLNWLMVFLPLLNVITIFCQAHKYFPYVETSGVGPKVEGAMRRQIGNADIEKAFSQIRQ